MLRGLQPPAVHRRSSSTAWRQPSGGLTGAAALHQSNFSLDVLQHLLQHQAIAGFVGRRDRSCSSGGQRDSSIPAQPLHSRSNICRCRGAAWRDSQVKGGSVGR